MDRSFDYALVQVCPDARRGEFLNVGIVVFGEKTDVRIAETRKLNSISSRAWDSDIQAYAEIIEKVDASSQSVEDRVQILETFEGMFSLSPVGWFKAKNSDSYEKEVAAILRDLVQKPRKKKSRRSSSVVSEISSALRERDLLATKNDPLSSGLVRREYKVAPGLKADFAQLNSQLHVAAVLDLRANNPQLAQAALKAVVLDRADEQLSSKYKVHKIGVYSAATSRLSELRDNLAILKPYADDIYNWEDHHDREELQRVFLHAYNVHKHEAPR